MKTAHPVDTARVELFLSDLRLPAIKQVWAQRVAHQVVFFELIERFAQIAREFVDSEVPSFPVADRENVLVDWRAGLDFLFDAVETGAEHHCERQIRIA